jgi:xylan 1,4-beta-xylosidase
MYNVARVFARMGDRRVAVSGGDDITSVLASVSASRITVLAVNQQWDFARSVDNAKPTRIDVTLQPVRASNGRVAFVRYVIDREHSNVYRRLMSGASNVAPELTPVERGTIAVVDGVVHLPGVTVEPSSISYWEITGHRLP